MTGCRAVLPTATERGGTGGAWGGSHLPVGWLWQPETHPKSRKSAEIAPGAPSIAI